MKPIQPCGVHQSRQSALLTLSLCLLFSAALPASEKHAGLPTPTVELSEAEVSVPFSLPETFPVPVVEVMFNGRGPWRLAVDTAMGGTILLRQELASAMNLPVIGKAMVGDSSGAEPKPADLIRIEEMAVGGLSVRGIIGIGFSAGNEHLSEIPGDLDGILGKQIYSDLLTTLDYPNKRLVLRRGTLDPALPGTIAYEEVGGVMAIDIQLAGSTIPVFVDSGHRGTITLPRSLAEQLPLSGEWRRLKPISTVTNTYQRDATRLDGDAMLAGVRLLQPEIAFADESSPRLIGFGVLEHFAVTIDQRTRHLQFTPTDRSPIQGVSLVR